MWLAVPKNLQLTQLGIKGMQLIKMDVSLSWSQPVPFKINITIIDLCEWCACAKWRLIYGTNFLLLSLMDELGLLIMKRWSNFQLHISHLHRQSMMKINLILFSYCHPNVTTDKRKKKKKKDLIESLWERNRYNFILSHEYISLWH